MYSDVTCPPRLEFEVEDLDDGGGVAGASPGDDHLLHRASCVGLDRAAHDLVPGRRHVLHAVPAPLAVTEFVRLAEVILRVGNGRVIISRDSSFSDESQVLHSLSKSFLRQ